MTNRRTDGHRTTAKTVSIASRGKHLCIQSLCCFNSLFSTHKRLFGLIHRSKTKTKKKTIEQSGHSGVRKERQSDGRGEVYDGKDLRKRYLLSLEWKRVGVIPNDSTG